MPSIETGSRTFNASLEETRAAACDALASLGADVDVSGDGMTVRGKTGWSLMSFGENVNIELEPQDDEVLVAVSSKQRFQLFDLSKRNQRNVGSVLNTMSTRLPS